MTGMARKVLSVILEKKPPRAVKKILPTPGAEIPAPQKSPAPSMVNLAPLKVDNLPIAQAPSIPVRAEVVPIKPSVKKKAKRVTKKTSAKNAKLQVAKKIKIAYDSSAHLVTFVILDDDLRVERDGALSIISDINPEEVSIDSQSLRILNEAEAIANPSLEFRYSEIVWGSVSRNFSVMVSHISVELDGTLWVEGLRAEP